MEGFLILLQRYLKLRFGKTGLDIDFLFVTTKTKIIVHGPDRNPLGDTDILAEITSAEGQKEVVIHPAKGTQVDMEIIQKILKETVQPDVKITITDRQAKKE